MLVPFIPSTTEKPYFPDTSNVLSKLLNKVIFSNNNIEMIGNPVKSSDVAILEQMNCKFVNTDKEFICQIKESNKNIMVLFLLSKDTTLLPEEIKICKSLMEELSDVEIAFYVDNESGTMDFDEMFYPNLASSAEINNDIEEDEDIEESPITEETTIETSLSSESEEAENNSSETTQIQSTPSNEATKEETTSQISPVVTETVVSSNVWEQINQKMKELNLPFKIVNRIRVMKNNYVKKYKDEYESYIKDYAEDQFRKFIESQN